MPYTFRKLSKPSKNSKGKLCKYGVFKKDSGKLVGKTTSRAEAIRYLGALHSNTE